MRSQMKYALGVAGLSLMLAVPAYAYTGTANGGNDGLGNGMGKRNGTQVHAHGVGKTTGHEISVYGTGTGSQFRSGYTGTPAATTNRQDGYAPRTYADGTADGRYRTTAAAPARGIGWGWLGLLGLFGLAGFRNRNPQENR